MTTAPAPLSAEELAEIRLNSVTDEDTHPNGLADQSCKDRAALISHIDVLTAERDAAIAREAGTVELCALCRWDLQSVKPQQCAGITVENGNGAIRDIDCPIRKAGAAHE